MVDRKAALRGLLFVGATGFCSAAAVGFFDGHPYADFIQTCGSMAMAIGIIATLGIEGA